MIKMEDGFFEIARPHVFQNGAMILDGDEDSQVAVYEDGKVTDWTLNLLPCPRLQTRSWIEVETPIEKGCLPVINPCQKANFQIRQKACRLTYSKCAVLSNKI